MRFDGWIAAFGTASGNRFVVGRWHDSPYGDFADVMWEDQDGRRTLLAPDPEVAELVSSTYRFDEVRVVPVAGRSVGPDVTVEAAEVALSFRVGPSDLLGRLLRVVPAPVREAAWWARVTDPVARTVLPGVRTYGVGAAGRRQWYAARDHRPLLRAAATVAGLDLGAMTDVDPPVRFGFGSAPRRPALVRCVSRFAPPAPDETD